MDSWKRCNAETIAAFLVMLKMLLLFFIKEWIHQLSSILLRVFKKRKGLMLVPSLILLVWFPISCGVDVYLLRQHGLLAIWWCCIDAYCSYFFTIVFKTFMQTFKTPPRVSA